MESFKLEEKSNLIVEEPKITVVKPRRKVISQKRIKKATVFGWMAQSRWCPYCVFLGIATSMIVTTLVLVFPNVFNAECYIYWKFTKPCRLVQTAIMKQLMLLEADANCTFGEGMCPYQLVNWTANEVKAMHITPTVFHFVDDLVFKFYPVNISECNVMGISKTRAWILSNPSRNYCNLHTIVAAAITLTLNDDKEFEFISNGACLNYSPADCK